MDSNELMIPTPLHIGFVLSPYQEYSGVGVYTHNLIRSLLRLAPQNTYTVFVAIDWAEKARKSLPGVRIVPTDIPNGPSWRRGLASWRYRRIAERFGPLSVDILHSCSFPGFTCSGVNFLTVYDMRSEDLPAINQPLRNTYSRFMKRSALRRMDGIITISEFTRSRLVHHFPEVGNKAFSVLLGGGDRFMGCKDGTPPLDRPYVLAVSHIMARKNLGLLVTAFNQLIEKSGLTHALLIIGKQYEQDIEFTRALESSRYRDRIVIRSGLMECELATAYRHAALFVFPSLYEGFGIPLVEAGVFGIPSLAAKTSVFPEMFPNNQEYLFAPNSPNELTDKMLSLLGDESTREKASIVMKALSEKMTWERTARETLKVYKMLHDKKQGRSI